MSTESRGLEPGGFEALASAAIADQSFVARPYPAMLSLDDDVPLPSYAAILDWLRNTGDKAYAFDLWARGNYARRIIANRRDNRLPVLVPCTNVREARWAYRRLALMGLPAEFIYTGELSPVQKVLTFHPAGDYKIDAGWGYTAAIGSIVRHEGREWFPVMGCTRPMPSGFIDWITYEASGAFLRGDVFIAPAELVGIESVDFLEDSQMMSDIQGGTVASAESRATEVLANIELPQLDSLSPAAFEKVLYEHAEDLIRFRSAVRKLVSQSESIDDGIAEVRAEIADLSYSDKNRRFRDSVARLGGALTMFSAAVGAAASALAAKAAPEVLFTAIGAAAGTGAATILVDSWKQAMERRNAVRTNRLSILWELGVQNAASVRRSPSQISVRRYARSTPVVPEAAADCHWLCPPEPGLAVLAVRKVRS